MDKITRQVRIEHWTQIMNECLNSGMNKTKWCRAKTTVGSGTQKLGSKYSGVRPHKEIINISKEFIKKHGE